MEGGMMAETKLSEAELMAVIAVLKGASAEEQENACRQLEEEWKAPGFAARARELLKAEREAKVVPLKVTTADRVRPGWWRPLNSTNAKAVAAEREARAVVALKP